MLEEQSPIMQVACVCRLCEDALAGVVGFISQYLSEAQEELGIHISEFAGKLWCPHCGKPNRSEEWPLSGDMVPFYFQTEPGNYNLTVRCSHCGKEWYVVWDDNPGPVRRLGL